MQANVKPAARVSSRMWLQSIETARLRDRERFGELRTQTGQT